MAEGRGDLDRADGPGPGREGEGRAANLRDSGGGNERRPGLKKKKVQVRDRRKPIWRKLRRL